MNRPSNHLLRFAVLFLLSLLLPACKPKKAIILTPHPLPLSVTVAATTSHIPAHDIEGDTAVADWLSDNGSELIEHSIPLEFTLDRHLPYVRVEKFLSIGGAGGFADQLLKLRDDPDPGILIELPCCCDARWQYTWYPDTPPELPPFEHLDPATNALHLKFAVDADGNLSAEDDYTPDEFAAHLRQLRKTHPKIAVHLLLVEDDMPAEPVLHLLRLARDQECKFSVPYKPSEDRDLFAHPSPVSGTPHHPLHPFPSTTTLPVEIPPDQK